jgi:hypothetical protein
MAAAENPMGEGQNSEPTGETMVDHPIDPSPSGTPAPADAPSIFVKKEMLGGKDWKAGEEIVFKIKAIDPETGEAELYYAPEKAGDDHMEEPADAMSAMDNKFPADQGGAGGY